MAQQRSPDLQRGKIDPETGDVSRRRKTVKWDRIPVPDELREWEAKAEKRLRAKPYPALVVRQPVGTDREEWTPNHEDESLWALQLADAFGTRSSAVINTFLTQLENLCHGRFWDEESGQYVMDEAEFNTALTMLQAAKPRNEMEAALAAQMVAVHFMQMKLAARATKFDFEPKTAAVASKLARTFVMQMEALRTMRGGKRTTRQSIKVTKETHQHVHYHDHRGEAGRVHQPHGTARSATAEISEVPGEESGGKVVRLPSRPGKARV